MKKNIFLMRSLFLTMSLSSINSYAEETMSPQPESSDVVKSMSVSSVKNTDVLTSFNNSDSGKSVTDKNHVTPSPANEQSSDSSISSKTSQRAGQNNNTSEKYDFEKKYQEYVNKIDGLQKIADANIDLLNKKLESIYIADKKLGGVDGPGYYYRFKNDSKSSVLDKGLYYVYTKKSNSDVNLLKGMLVNFSLSEKRPSGKTISQATNISLAYNDDLPSIAKRVFTVAKPGDSIKVVTLAQYIYPTRELLPSGVEPDDTLIYTFDINRQYEK
ncbi:hypothetical protein AD37_2230 [Escherichia coli 1-110-08_S4_C3]|uniref:hypothetical protein n=1 Tax=Escherichia coli TaxID=562 RepID=UPI000449B64B|nr:hypothetical protein [Escherichia coli]EYD99177.1 hypothetical protein AD37_2230 [Escherichia coli 1-110-08_S4_C3]MDA6408275.1 hypothetical protein [Escherichia coli]